MALKALKCPNCDANIEIDDDREYGFCSYCGAQIQIKDVLEIRSSQEFDETQFFKLMEDAQAYLMMGDYFRAEEGFMEMIRLYPGKAIGYERLICAITHDYKLFPIENSERLQRLTRKMLAVAASDEKAHYEEINRKVSQGISRQLMQQLPEGREARIEKLRRDIHISFGGTALLIFICILIQDAAEKSLVLSIFGIILCLAAIVTGYRAIAGKVKLDKLLEDDTE